MRKQLTAVDAAAAKMLCTELQCKVVDKCLQFFGGYGYLVLDPTQQVEPINRAFAPSS